MPQNEETAGPAPTAAPLKEILGEALVLAQTMQQECERIQRRLYFMGWFTITVFITVAPALFRLLQPSRFLHVYDIQASALAALYCSLCGLGFWTWQLHRRLDERRAALFELVKALHEVAAKNSRSPVEELVFKTRLSGLSFGR